MRKNNAKLVGVAVTTLIGMTAWAGADISNMVYVGSSSAYGSLEAVRNSSDSMQYIGCHTWTYNGGSPYALQAVCYAQSANNTYASCFSSDPVIVAAVRTINGDSDIEFGWDSNAQCTFISVGNSSRYAPKNP